MTMDLSNRSTQQLRTLKENAERLLRGPSEEKRAEAMALIQEIEAEQESRKMPSKPVMCGSYHWKSSNPGNIAREMRNRLEDENGTVIAEIKLVATHGSVKRDGGYRVIFRGNDCPDIIENIESARQYIKKFT